MTWQLEPLEFIFAPASLGLDHLPEGLRKKGVTRTMKGYRHSSTIAMTIALVAAYL